MAAPFEDPPWIQGLPSPYFQESHRRFQKACRAFIDENLNQYALQWEREGQVPSDVMSKFARANMLVPCLAAPLPVAWLKRLNLETLPGGVKAEEFDDLHSYIWFDEMARSGLLGVCGSLTTGFSYGLPPLLEYGSPGLQERFMPDLLTGRKRSCIAVTEPDAGSDVANITTMAEKSSDGKHYIVNGTKKWITNGIWADYGTMAVRTGGPGPSGVSFLVVPLKGQRGVTCKKLDIGGSVTAGTTYIELDDVKVPVENLLGKEGHGFKYILANFNHERIGVSVQVARQARVALATTFRYTMKREAFGKTLMEQPVVRLRLAEAAAEVEALTAWLEQLVYQFKHLSKAEADLRLGGITALVKAKAGKVLDKCARTGTLLHGGNGFTRTGQGELVEKIYREVNAARIPGGSQDVMFDLAVRQVVKNYQASLKKDKKPARL